MSEIEFTANILPTPQARPRFTRQGHAYDTQRCKDYKQAIALKAMAAMRGKEMAKGAVILTLAFYFPLPKSWSKGKRLERQGTAHTVRPDADNLAKAVMDALGGIVWHDDKQVSCLNVLKAYGGDNGHVYIKAEWWE